MGDDQEGDGRYEIVSKVLARMREEETAQPGKPYATVLRLRQSRPKATIEDLARELSIQVSSPVSPSAFLKVLQRAAAVPCLARRVSFPARTATAGVITCYAAPTDHNSTVDVAGSWR